MNRNKARSSLKKVITQSEEEPDPARVIKRRISFSGKKFIREFNTTEKPRDYDNSYEISDHINGEDISGQSHGTATASVLQSTAHITLPNEMDKENTPLGSTMIAVPPPYDQQPRLSHCTLKLQTSINVTLLPDELGRNSLRCSDPSNTTSRDSLSLCEFERQKLREHSLYKMPVFEKTMDLVPENLLNAGNEPKGKENAHKTIITPQDISCVTLKETEIVQKTVVYENNDITCDFTDIEPMEMLAAAPAEVMAPTEQESEIFEVVEERDYINYLADDSTLSSPLIPLDVISENGISKKLNFQQLNDALNSGRIQLFPNGPKTPTTDKKGKQRRFWNGLEQQPMEQDAPLRETIKPRGTLNFNDSMMVSPVPQKSEQRLVIDQPVKAKSAKDTKRTYRFSQADELMLDNTNFLVHAKMGDETQSRNSSKCSSRRETTYDNTAMELDDLEKQEAAVVAAVESTKHQHTVLRPEAMEEDDLRTTSVIPQSSHEHRDTVALNEVMEETNLNPIEIRPPQQRRLTMHMAEPIEDVSFVAPTASAKKPLKIRRQTMHMTETIEEDMVLPHQVLPSISQPLPIVKQSGKRRESIHTVQTIEEDSFCFNDDVVLPKPNQHRLTMHMAEAIEEDIIRLPKETKPQQSAAVAGGKIRRQTLHLADPIEEDQMPLDKCIVPSPKESNQCLFEDSIKPQKELSGPSASLMNKRRDTLHLAEPIVEDFVRPELAENKGQCVRRRQTMHLADPIKEDSFCQISHEKDNIIEPQPAAPKAELKGNKRRQTLLRTDDIEEDSFCSLQVVEANATRYKNAMTSVEAMEEDEIISDTQLQFSVAAPPAPILTGKQRKTICVSEPIWEDMPSIHIDSKSKTTSGQSSNVVEAIEEDICSAAQALNLQAASDKNLRKARQTLVMEQVIEEDTSCVQSQETYPSKPQREPAIKASERGYSNSKQSLLLTESMGMELLSQSLNEDAEKAGNECPVSDSSSSEWWSQMRTNARQTLAKFITINPDYSIPVPAECQNVDKQPDSPAEDKENIYNRMPTRTSMETPKTTNKHRSYYPITPGRSMIEFEDLEDECKSPAKPPTARTMCQAVDMDLDMDTSCCDSPKPMTSLNVKRLPIHLTPNLPYPKKRSLQLNENVSQLDIDTTMQNESHQTPTARNKSRIPVLAKSISSPWREAEQLDGTVQMVRAQMIRGASDQFAAEITNLVRDKLEVNQDIFEDNPITISDVSNHFKSKRDVKLNQTNQQPSKESSIDSRSSNEYAQVHNKYMNLNGDTVIIDAAAVLDDERDASEIEKTRLSLVSTLLDEEDDDNKQSSDDDSQINLDAANELELCLDQANPPVLAGTADACKKCKYCRRSIDGGTARSSLDNSFQLPDWGDLDKALDRLERLRQRPGISDVNKYWELKNMELSDDETIHDVNETECTHNDENRLSLSRMLKIFDDKWNELKQKYPKPKPRKNFVECLEATLRAQQPNWIFDYQLQCFNKYIFSHRKITTFRITVNFKPLDLLQTNLKVQSIKSDSALMIPKAQWVAYEHLIDFQVRLYLPLNLEELLDGDNVEDFVKFLDQLDGICTDTVRLCKKMYMVVINNKSRLIRESNRNVVMKTVRKFVQKDDEAYMRVEKTHFKIVIGNVQEISFNDIIQPPLYEFDENIQYLPKGIDFLEVFLSNPEKYLKCSIEPNVT